MERLTIDIGGMSCGHCVSSVSKALKDLDGVTVEQVRVGQAVVSFDPSAASAARIATAIEDEGYDVVATK